MQASARIAAIGATVGEQNLSTFDANAVAENILGNSIYANVMMLGYAWQAGLVPVSLEALLRAIELNAVEVDNNKRAFNWGRVAAASPESLPDRGQSPFREKGSDPESDESLDDVISRRAEFLVSYQDQALADRYLALVQRVRDAEFSDDSLVEAVAKSYFKLLSYKDEYEVARLHTQTGFLDSVRRDFGNKAKLRFHMAPPGLSRKKDARGRPFKKEFGGWIVPVLRLLAGMRGLRGTRFDPFGYTAERRMERALIGEFEELVDKALLGDDPDKTRQSRSDIVMYQDIRGYGPVKEQAIKDVHGRLAVRPSADVTNQY
jgi:indolepyruvate ferredoxin oxidoreductase